MTNSVPNSLDSMLGGKPLIAHGENTNSHALNIFGQTAFEKITCEISGGAYYVVRQTAKRGDGVPPHVHSLEDEIVFINAGEFEIYLDGKITTAGPGTIINFPRGVFHGFRVLSEIGDTTWVITPGASFQTFFREVGSFPPGPPDLARLDALHAKHGITMPPPSMTWW